MTWCYSNIAVTTISSERACDLHPAQRVPPLSRKSRNYFFYLVQGSDYPQECVQQRHRMPRCSPGFRRQLRRRKWNEKPTSWSSVTCTLHFISIASSFSSSSMRFWQLTVLSKVLLAIVQDVFFDWIVSFLTEFRGSAMKHSQLVCTRRDWAFVQG